MTSEQQTRKDEKCISFTQDLAQVKARQEAYEREQANLHQDVRELSHELREVDSRQNKRMEQFESKINSALESIRTDATKFRNWILGGIAVITFIAPLIANWIISDQTQGVTKQEIEQIIQEVREDK